jgi:hypothetical protein
MARIRRRQGRIEYKQPDGSWSRTKPSPAASKPATVKPARPNPYTSGKPNPNAGGGVKPKPRGGSLAGYRNDVAALKRLVKGKGPLAAAAAKRLAVLGIKAAPGAALAGALAGSAGRPGAAQMSKLGLSPGRSTKSADAPTYKTPLNQSKPKPKPHGPGGSPSGSGKGQAQQRKPLSGGGGGASGSSKPKPKPKSEYEQARSKLTVKSSKADRDAVRDKGMMAWANAHKGKQDAVGKKARAYLAEQERKKKFQNKATSNQGISARNNAARASRNIA